MSFIAPLRTLPIAVLVVVLLGLMAVPALASQISLTDDGFEPGVIRVEAGEDIVWLNATDEEQTIVGEDGTWDSGPLQPDETFSVALRDAGTVRYATADGAAEGRIIVRAAADEEAEDVAAPAPTTLPQTGQPSAALVGWASILVGAGLVLLRRAETLRVPVGPRA